GPWGAHPLGGFWPARLHSRKCVVAAFSLAAAPPPSRIGWAAPTSATGPLAAGASLTGTGTASRVSYRALDSRCSRRLTTMKLSSDRILTTHTGSLPRAQDLTITLEALDSGRMPDPVAFDARVRRAVGDVVRQQLEAGVDIVNDGEQGKVGYSTYVRHRLTGFDGQAAAPMRADWADLPEAAAGGERRSTIMRPACNGSIDWKDRTAVQKDIANFKAALESAKPADAFMTAASPGVIAHFLKNEHYPSRDAYLARLADIMKEEYDSIHQAGFVLQIDCPDLAMGRHLAFPEVSNAEFLKIAAANIEALNHALRDIPPDRMRLPLCWGNYEGPHHRDIPLRELLPVALQAKPQALSFEGANPRHEHEWVVFREIRLPDDRVIIPGVLDSTTNFI